MDKSEPTVLFVDDEPGILKSLRRLFIDEEWRIFLAEGAAEGLEILAREKVDLVVSDVRMPEMNGIDFLLKVKETYPEVSRVFLSGYAEKNNIAKALTEGCALQIIPKPWNDTELRDILAQLLEQKRHTKSGLKAVNSVLDSFANLPPLPAVYKDLRECLANREDFTFDQVSKIIRTDTAMSADLLHWANSALFGQRRQVETVKRAVMLLGIEIVECLVLSESIQRTLAGLTRETSPLDAATLQRHSMCCAILARLLAASDPRYDEQFIDRAFIAGLLHDLGLLAVASLFPEQFSRIDELITKEDLSLAAAEEQILKTSHAQIGAYLADRWSLPAVLVKAIRWHHEPLSAPEEDLLSRLVATADLLAVRFGYGIGYEQPDPEYAGELFRLSRLTDQRIEDLNLELSDMLESGEMEAS